MNLFAQVAPTAPTPGRLQPPAPTPVEVLEPHADRCSAVPPPEGHVKLRNYRLVGDGVRVYTPTGDVNTTPSKGKLVARWEFCVDVSPSRNKILELVLPEQPGSDVLEAIVRPAARRGLVPHLNDDAYRFLQRALLTPSPSGMSAISTPEPAADPTPRQSNRFEGALEATGPSLADELREAEESATCGNLTKREASKELEKNEAACDAIERERLGRLALSVEQDDSEDVTEDRGALSAASRHLDTLLAESRDLHDELAEIYQDIQTQTTRAGRCAAAARALEEESRTLRFLDDVVALLRGDLAGAVRARAWPFAFGGRMPERNYII